MGIWVDALYILLNYIIYFSRTLDTFFYEPRGIKFSHQLEF